MPSPWGSHRSVGDIWQKGRNLWLPLNVSKSVIDGTEMIKNLWTIEYRCDWIVATWNHEGEVSSSSKGSVPRGAQRVSSLSLAVERKSESLVGGLSTAVVSKLFWITYSYHLKKIKHTCTIDVNLFIYKLYTHTMLVSKYLNTIYI